jgi:hypothetical protein
VTKLKIEHGSDAVSTKCYVITGNNKQQSICWEGGADYEAIRYLQKRIAELETASSGPTYDDACETISDGLGYLMNALSIDGDDWGDDVAPDCVIANILKRMAINLEPMGIRPNDDEQTLELPTKEQGS